MEFYGPQRLLATRALRLVRVAIARGGFGFSVGFPLRLRDAYIGRAVRAGYTVVEVGEVDRLQQTCASRQVVAVWIPAKWGRRRDSRLPTKNETDGRMATRS